MACICTMCANNQGKFDLRKERRRQLALPLRTPSLDKSMIPGERKERQQIAIEIYRQLWIHPGLRKSLVFVQRKMVDVFAAAGLNILLCLPVSLVLFDSDINTYSSRRGRGINLEGAEHSVIEVAGVLGRSSSSDGCSGIVLALVLVFLGITTEETSDGGNDDGEVAHG